MVKGRKNGRGGVRGEEETDRGARRNREVGEVKEEEGKEKQDRQAGRESWRQKCAIGRELNIVGAA